MADLQEIPASNAAAAELDNESQALLTILARNIRRYRRRHGMTRRNLADVSGVSVPHLARIESVQGNVSVAVLSRVARAFKVPVTTLFVDEEAECSADLSLIVEILRRQPVSKLALIRDRLLADSAPAQLARRSRVVLTGMGGAGKTTVGKALAQRLEVPFVELECELEKHAGLSASQLLALCGEQGYRNLERKSIERILAECPRLVLATGAGVIDDPTTYELLLTRFFSVWLYAKPGVHFHRLSAKGMQVWDQPALYRDALEHTTQMAEQRAALYRRADVQIDTTRLNVPETVELIFAELNARRISEGL